MIIWWLKEMSAWWYVLMIVTFLTFVNSKIDLDSPISLARCRAACLFKMQMSRLTDLDCSRSLNCSQCWKACGAVKSRSPLCAATDCGPGSSSPISPVPLEEVLVVNDSRVSWPPVAGPVVYVVMADGSPLYQTLEPSVALPSAADLETVWVMVVDWRGLVRVFGPVAESPVDQALHILRSLGMENKLLANSQYIEKFSATSLIPKVIFHTAWRLDVESVHPQPPLVIGKISWRPYHHQVLKGNLLTSYLVTWTVDGDVLQGNLLTNSSTVTLSLLPEMLYRIQVSMLNTRSSNVHSELLVLDTRHFYTKANNLSSSFRSDFIPSENSPLIWRYHRFEDVTIVLMFLGLIVVSAWRWRHRNFLTKKKQLYERIDYLKL